MPQSSDPHWTGHWQSPWCTQRHCVTELVKHINDISLCVLATICTTLSYVLQNVIKDLNLKKEVVITIKKETSCIEYCIYGNFSGIWNVTLLKLWIYFIRSSMIWLCIVYIHIMHNEVCTQLSETTMYLRISGLLLKEKCYSVWENDVTLKIHCSGS